MTSIKTRLAAFLAALACAAPAAAQTLGAHDNLQVQGVAAGAGIGITNGAGALTIAGLAPGAQQKAAASPTAPASTSAYAMQGLAGSITPARGGRVLITIDGTIVAPAGTTVDNGVKYQISWGTGTAPANAAALTGTQCGPVQEYSSAVTPTAAADVAVPFSVSCVVTGLTNGTVYWVDLAAESVTTASDMGLANVGESLIEF